MRITVTSQQVASTFERLRDLPVFAESAAIVARGGLPVEMIQAMCLRPEILESFASTSSAIYPGGIVEREVKELIIIEVSRTNACQFCTDSHVSMVRSLGMSDAPLTLLDHFEKLPPRQRLAVEYSRAAMTDSNRIPDELFERMREHFSEPEIVELTAMIGLISMLNMFNNCLGVAYRGDYDVPATPPSAASPSVASPSRR